MYGYLLLIIGYSIKTACYAPPAPYKEDRWQKTEGRRQKVEGSYAPPAPYNEGDGRRQKTDGSKKTNTEW